MHLRKLNMEQAKELSLKREFSHSHIVFKHIFKLIKYQCFFIKGEKMCNNE